MATLLLLRSRCSSVARIMTLRESFILMTNCRLAHTVRVIVTKDLEDGQGYEGDVVHVKAGFARNFLIPQKKALYATPKNFERLGMLDAAIETPEQQQERLEKERLAAEEGGEELKAADLLRYYLRNKVLTIWRRVDPATKTVHPGMVDHRAIRSKFSKQLKIDLDPEETIHLRETPLISHETFTNEELEAMLEKIPTDQECKVQIRQLGAFVAKLTLAGGYVVPLRVEIAKR